MPIHYVNLVDILVLLITFKSQQDDKSQHMGHHEILVLFLHAQMSSPNVLADEFNIARSINLCPGLLPYPYFVYVSSEGSDESAHMRRLTRACGARKFDK